MWASRRCQSMSLAKTREAFDHADFVFELKYDGFRALAYIDGGGCRLVSRKGHVYKAYAPLCEWIGRHLRAQNAVLDGELACLEGKPQFKPDNAREFEQCAMLELESHLGTPKILR